MSTYAYNIWLRNDSETNWNLSGSTIVLDKGEIGIAYNILDEFAGLKIGNGIKTWDNLDYLFKNLEDYYTSSQILAITGLTNYYEQSNLYTKTEIDDTLNTDYYDRTQIDTILSGYTTLSSLNSNLTNYYTKSQIDTTLGDYATISYVGNVINATTGRTDLAYYYRKTETDAKYLWKNTTGYTISTDYTASGHYSALYIQDSITTTDQTSLLRLYHDSDNSSPSSALYLESRGDTKTHAIKAIGFYKGANTNMTPITAIPQTSTIRTETEVVDNTRAIQSVSLYGYSGVDQQANNIGVVGFAQNANRSNIGVLGVVTTSESSLKELNGGAIGTGVYAYAPNASGDALKIHGNLAVYNGSSFQAGYTGSIPSGSTLQVVEGIIVGYTT
jgi:hypothetical protein